MRCWAEFTFDADMRLPDGTDPVAMTFPDGATFELRNRVEGLARANEVLSAVLVFEADDFDTAIEVAERKAVYAANCLAFTTSRAFRIRRFLRMVDWTIGVEERRIVIFHQTPEWELAEPAFDGEFGQTVSRIMAMQSGEVVQSAMRWYRLGLLADEIEDQFGYIWFAVEIVAEALKDQDKVTTNCPKCQAALFCEGCGEHPVHRKFASDAIGSLIATLAPPNADATEVSRTLLKIRNTLLHGRSMESLEGKLPCTPVQALDVLAMIAWRGISMMADNDADPEANVDAALTFGRLESIRRRRFRVAVNGAYVCPNPESPSEGDVPEMKISTLYDGQEVPSA